MALLKLNSPTDRATIELVLNRPIATLATDIQIIQDSLALGLCCCERSPRLLVLLVKYCSHHFGIIFENYPWPKLLKLPLSYGNPDAEYRIEISRMLAIFPVENLTNQIQSLLPLRQQKISDTIRILFAFKGCFKMVIEEEMDDDVDDDVDDIDLGSKTLDVMRREYLKFSDLLLSMRKPHE